MRLRRSRKGKTAIDVTTTEQAGLKRIRLTMGEPNDPRKRNTDMDARELDESIVLLQWHQAKLNGQVPWTEGDE